MGAHSDYGRIMRLWYGCVDGLNHQEEEADTPEDLSEPAPPPVEPADRRDTLSKMVIPQIHEEEAAREAPPVLMDPPVLPTPPVVVESPAVAHSLVQLERSQRTRAPPSYLRDFWCDLVDMHSIL